LLQEGLAQQSASSPARRWERGHLRQRRAGGYGGGGVVARGAERGDDQGHGNMRVVFGEAGIRINDTGMGRWGVTLVEPFVSSFLKAQETQPACSLHSVLKNCHWLLTELEKNLSPAYFPKTRSPTHDLLVRIPRRR